MRLLIAGAGGHGRALADAAIAAGGLTDLAFLDDYDVNETVEGWPIVGRLGDLQQIAPAYDAFAAGFGKSELRLEMLIQALALGMRCLPILHPDSSISKYCSIGEGSVVFAGACVNIGVRLGIGCIVNTGATVDHDCKLGDGVHVSPGAHLAGNVSIGARTWFGIGAVAKQGITIGSDAMIGAGAVVLNDVLDGQTVIGNPAKPIKP